MKQETIFDIDETWREEWQDMPEFARFDNKPVQKIVVNFRTKEDVKRFAQIIGQTLTFDTDTIWYPPYKTLTGVYVDES